MYDSSDDAIGAPPTPIPSDYIELGTLVVLFIVGAPLNLAAYTQMLERPTSTRLDILRRHLNYSDLLVLFVYVPSRACWLLTYDFRGGNLLCKLVKCAHTLAFQISSNVIVCIALDRLLSVTSSAHNSADKAHRRIRYMLLFAWLLAIAISAPQFAIWKSFLAFEKYNWSQCSQIWQINRMLQHRLEQQQRLLLMQQHQSMPFEHNTTDVGGGLSNEENIYTIIHMLFIFWIPSAIVLLCYLFVSCWVWINSRPTPASGRLLLPRVSYHTGIETVDTTIITRATIAVCTIWRHLVRRDHLFLADTPRANYNRPAPQIIVNGSDVSDRHMTRQSSTLSSRYQSHMINSQSYNARLTRTKAIRVSCLLVASYLILWTPYNVLSLWQFIHPEGFDQVADKVYCLHGVIVLNSVINPFLYGVFRAKKFCPRKSHQQQQQRLQQEYD